MFGVPVDVPRLASSSSKRSVRRCSPGCSGLDMGGEPVGEELRERTRCRAARPGGRLRPARCRARAGQWPAAGGTASFVGGGAGHGPGGAARCGPRRCWSVRTWRGSSGGDASSATSPSKVMPVKCWDSSGPTARARPHCSACSRRWPNPRAAASPIPSPTGLDSPRRMHRRTRPRTAVVRRTHGAREPRAVRAPGRGPRHRGCRRDVRWSRRASPIAATTSSSASHAACDSGWRSSASCCTAPRVLLLDEPFTGLDDESAQRMVGRLAALRDAGTLVVLATHDLMLVESLVDRACIVKGGVLLPLDPSLPLAEAYRAVVGTRRGPGSGGPGSLVLEATASIARHQRPNSRRLPQANAEASHRRHRASRLGAACEGPAHRVAVARGVADDGVLRAVVRAGVLVRPRARRHARARCRAQRSCGSRSRWPARWRWRARSSASGPPVR